MKAFYGPSYFIPQNDTFANGACCWGQIIYSKFTCSSHKTQSLLIHEQDMKTGIMELTDHKKNILTWVKWKKGETRKSSCMNAKGILPAV